MCKLKYMSFRDCPGPDLPDLPPSIKGIYLGFTRKGFQCDLRSATASLLIKNKKCTKEYMRLFVVLAQKSRHIAMCLSLWINLGKRRLAVRE